MAFRADGRRRVGRRRHSLRRTGKGAAARGLVDRFVEQARIETVAVTADHLRFAQEGLRRFGRGRHEAALSLGDCFTYAPARATGEPVLSKGTGFHLTDVGPAA